MAAGRMVKAAARLLDALGESDCAIAGGIAVNAHGFVRATRDVDVMVSIPLAEARKRLEAKGISVRLLRRNPLDGEFSCLRGVLELGPRPIDAVPFDVLPQLVPFAPRDAMSLTVHGRTLKVVDTDTLIRLKLKAGGPKDLYDVAVLVNLNPDWRPRVLELAAARQGLRDQMQSLIDHPQARHQAREVRQQDEVIERRRRARQKR